MNLNFSQVLLGVMICIASCMSGKGQSAAAVISAGYSSPVPINVAPGQIITFYVHGIGAGIKKPVRAASIPLPTSLANISATFIQYNPSIAIPILAVEPIFTCADMTQPGCGSYAAVTVQIPFNIGANNPQAKVGNLPYGGQVSFAEGGHTVAAIDVLPLADQIHVLRGCDMLISASGFLCIPIVTHGDGTLVSWQSPAKAAEELVMYAVGLGYTSSLIANGQAPPSAISTALDFKVTFDPRTNAGASRPPALGPGSTVGARPRFVGLIPGFVGLYQINVVLPALPVGLQPCDPDSLSTDVNSNLTINVFGPASVDGVGICVE